MKTEKQPCVGPVRPLQDEGEGGWPQLTLAPVGLGHNIQVVEILTLPLYII